jgi:site-specific DNA-methyltransferase (adenine-specific)
MTNAEIFDLPIPDIADPTSVIVLWTTDAHTQFAFECLKHWGYKISTQVFVWVKLKNGNPVKNVGPWTMKSCESAWLGTRGKAWSTLLKTQSELQLIMSERGKHSEKPGEAFDRLDRMFPGTSKIDLFARRTHPGWDVMGDEVEEEL